MSVASLLDSRHVVGTADEIESFFNVILYSALRYLPHNMRDTVQTFIKEYFFDCARVGYVLSCGTTKSQIIKSGELRCAGAKIIFQSKPLRVILEMLLQWFRALWEVRQYEQAKQEQAEKEQAAKEKDKARKPNEGRRADEKRHTRSLSADVLASVPGAQASSRRMSTMKVEDWQRNQVDVEAQISGPTSPRHQHQRTGSASMSRDMRRPPGVPFPEADRRRMSGMPRDPVS